MTYFSVTGEGGEMSLVDDIPFTAGNTLLDLVPLEDGMFAANGGFGADFRIGTYNDAGRNILEIETENPPLIDETVRKAQLDRSLLTSRLAKRPGGHRIALAFSEFNRIEVIDIADSTYQVIKGPRSTTPSITPDGPRPMNINQRKHEQAYFGIAATEDRIYAAFCGCVHRPLYLSVSEV